MHIHNVYFWLESNLDKVALNSFEQGLSSLCLDSDVKSGFFGKPAKTDRDVVENSYTYGLVLIFGDLNAHDKYQSGLVHDQFIAEHNSKWIRAVVHDIETI
jgi:hypothetical protein